MANILNTGTYGGEKDLSNLNKLEMACESLKSDGNDFPVLNDYVFDGTPAFIVLASSCNRWTSANTVNESIVYGSVNNGQTWEELLKINWTSTKSLETRICTTGDISKKKYNKLRISTKNGSRAYPSWANAIVFY